MHRLTAGSLENQHFNFLLIIEFKHNVQFYECIHEFIPLVKRQSSRRYSSYDDYLRRERLRRERERAQQLYEREQLKRQREELAAYQRRNSRPSAQIRRRPAQTRRRESQRITAPGESWHACLL